MASQDFSFETTEFESEHITAPWWPVSIQIALLGMSSLIAFMIFFVTPEIVRENMFAFSLIGYFFTPILTTGLLALTRGQDLKNRSIPSYRKNSGTSRIRFSGYLSITSFLVSLPLIWQLSTEIAARI